MNLLVFPLFFIQVHFNIFLNYLICFSEYQFLVIFKHLNQYTVILFLLNISNFIHSNLLYHSIKQFFILNPQILNVLHSYYFSSFHFLVQVKLISL